MKPAPGILSAVLASALRGLCAGAQAAPVLIQNPGFEEEVHGPNTFRLGPPPGWEAFNTNAVVNESIGTLNPSGTTYFDVGQYGGANVGIAFVNANGTSGVEFGLRQVLTETLQIDTTYSLSVGIGNIATGSSVFGGVLTEFNLDGFSGYRVDLLAGMTVLASDNNSLVSFGNEIPEGEFRTSLLTFDSTGVNPSLIGQPLAINLVNLNLVDPQHPNAHREVDFDDVSLDATATSIAAPEPGVGVLFGLGLLATVSLRARRATAHGAVAPAPA